MDSVVNGRVAATVVPPADVRNLRIGLAGLVPGDDHPYSWTALINGYDPDRLAKVADPVILQYLEEAGARSGLDGARVTHLWCDEPADARTLADICRVPDVVDDPAQMIGHIDAVLIPTDIGSEHVWRARPFVEAGIPVLVDKPLADTTSDLSQFMAWHNQGAAIMSCSALRYAPEMRQLTKTLRASPRPQTVLVSTVGTWDSYGIHALESVYSAAAPGGWSSVQYVAGARAETFVAQHRDGLDLIVVVEPARPSLFGQISALTPQGTHSAKFTNRYQALDQQLTQFLGYVRSGVAPFDFIETAELAALVIAGRESQRRGGQVMRISIPPAAAAAGGTTQ